MGDDEQESKEKGSPIEKKEKLLTCMLMHTVLATSIGSGFQHGYNTGVVANPADLIKEWMNETLQTNEEKLDSIWGFTTSIVCLGGIIGGALTNTLAGRFGRRLTLICNNATGALGAVLMGTSKFVNAFWMLVIGRFVVGINMGLNAGVAPMFLTEISPIRIRGALGSMYQLALTISILIAQGLSMEQVVGGKDTWPILFYLLILLTIYQALALFISPESPKYLLEKGREEEATAASVALCGKKGGIENVEAIKHELAEAKDLPRVTLKEMVRVKKYYKPLIIMCLLMAAQQLSGINAIIYYSTSIFQSAKLDESSSQIATVGVGVVNVLTTIVGVYLVEKLGRKPLLAIGFGGMTIATTAFMVCLFFVDKSEILAYMAIVLVYVYIILFAVGAGAIPWMLGSELFATAARPLGLSVAVPTNWLFNFIVTLTFPPLRLHMGAFVFLIFIVCNAMAFGYFMYAVPETKNKPIEEITAKFE